MKEIKQVEIQRGEDGERRKYGDGEGESKTDLQFSFICYLKLQWYMFLNRW